MNDLERMRMELRVMKYGTIWLIILVIVITGLVVLEW